MAKTLPLEVDGRVVAWMIFCPACHFGHAFYTDAEYCKRAKVGDPNGRVWTFENGNVDKPTFHQSMLVNQSDPAKRCHSLVTDGKIAFLSDCAHAMAGQTVELPDMDL